MGMIEEEDDERITIISAMDVVMVEQGEYAGMSIIPTIPFGIDQEITIEKSDILFTVEPNEFLQAIYLTRAEEAANILIDYVEKAEQRKKAREKHLH